MAKAQTSRRDLLPDIEEVSSTLRSDETPEFEVDRREIAKSERRGGFRSGLLVAILIFVAAGLAYQFAPEIADAVPQADPWISSYVTWVDETRNSLDANLRLLLNWLSAQAAALGE